MRLVTYNIRSCLEQGLAAVAAVIRSLDADVVALQEVDRRTIRSGGLDQAEELARAAGYSYHHFFAATPWEGGGEYGLGLLSRYPLLDVSTTRLPVDGPGAPASATEPRVLASARIEPDLTVLNTHFGLTHPQRLLQAQAVAERAGPRVIALGDFNATPDDPVLDSIRQGLHDAFADVAPAARISFPQEEGKIIDYAFIGGGLQLIGARVATSAGGASDHYPLVVDLRI